MGKLNLQQKPAIHFQGLLWLCLVVALSVFAFLTQPEPVNAAITKTMKACHICETLLPEATPTPDIGLCDIKCVDPDQTSEVTNEAPLQKNPTNLNNMLTIQYYWIDGCPGCEELLQTTIPAMEQEYGTMINFVKIELKSLEDVDQLYAMGESFGFTKEQIGVPFIVIADEALSGVDQIKQDLSGLIQKHLTKEGAISIKPENTATISSSDTSISTSEKSIPVSNFWLAVIMFLVIGIFFLIYKNRFN